ncbi:MAG: hypothetical protein L7R49_01170 [Nitrosopumilus sp.]|jgi:hypothetical protein|nr:hypothetical protein [Nitrosopumilus sp.]|tara:strand:+ start:282 stop:488 length:207 start_codon:yes stop_codon:yes gene_type:complete
MRFGKIEENEEEIKFDLELRCTNCNKKVPGGMKSAKNYFKTIEFNKELEKFKKTYLCGICRDKNRIKN